MSDCSARRSKSDVAANMPMLTHHIWWIDPSRLLLFIILPTFLLSSYFGEEVMRLYEIRNFIDFGANIFGIIAIFSMIIGSKIGEYSVHNYNSTIILDKERFENTLIMLLMLSIISHILLMSLIIMDINTVISAMSGSQGAVYAMKENMTKISGITSFTQMYILAMPLLATYRTFIGHPPRRKILVLGMILATLVAIRAFVILERFALIEVAAVFFIVAFSYGTKRMRFVGLFPILGIGGLYVLFAAGEFTRSWAYHETQYDSFWDYVNVRLLGYIATATNNGAGMYEIYGGGWGPVLTAAWVKKLPIWGVVGDPFADVPIYNFLYEYGSLEFNNPSGILSGLIDYGEIFSILYYLIIGIIGGVLYGLFRRGNIFAILYFPGWYIGYLVITQAIYWGDPRFFTVSMAAPLVALYLAGKGRGSRRSYAKTVSRDNERDSQT